MEKNIKEKCIYILNHFVIQQEATLWKSTIVQLKKKHKTRPSVQNLYYTVIISPASYFKNWNIIALQWASLMAQMVTNLPAMQETQVPSLGW